MELYYSTICVTETSTTNEEILFNVTGGCTSFSIDVFYNETGENSYKNSSFLIRQNNGVFSLEPKLSITDAEVFSDYFPTNIFGGYQIYLDKYVRFIDPSGE